MQLVLRPIFFGASQNQVSSFFSFAQKKPFERGINNNYNNRDDDDDNNHHDNKALKNAFYNACPS